MSGSALNLSSRPFLNRRPVLRFVVVVWALGLVLLTLNVSSYLRNRSGSTDLRAQLRALDEESRVVNEEISTLQSALEQLDPERQNNLVVYLNERIAERTFPWGALFDHLGEVLPRAVRLRNITPTVEKPDRRSRSGVEHEVLSVDLGLEGIARSDEDLYELLDGLWAHPSFMSPELIAERSQDSGEVSFRMTTSYLLAVESGPEDPADSEGEPAAELEDGTGERRGPGEAS